MTNDNNEMLTCELFKKNCAVLAEWYARGCKEVLQLSDWDTEDSDKTRLQHGFIHLTQEAAQQHSEAIIAPSTPQQNHWDHVFSTLPAFDVNGNLVEKE